MALVVSRAERAARTRMALAQVGPLPLSSVAPAAAPLRRLTGGRSLPFGLQTQLEQGFGRSLEDVRVHGGSSAGVARDLGADAVTTGSQIVFAPGKWRPDTDGGRKLIAHEVAHVLQQRDGRGPSGRTADGSLRVTAPGDVLERAADRAAAGALRGDRLGQEVHHVVGSCAGANAGAALPAALMHSSFEHKILGDLSPSQLRDLSRGKLTTVANKSPLMKKIAEKGDPRYWQDEDMQGAQEVRDLLRDVLDPQLAALERWRSGRPALADQQATGTHYNHGWGGQLVQVQCADRTIVATLGDMNAMPDFFGAYDDLQSVSSGVVQRVLDVIHREAYVALQVLRGQLAGEKFQYKEKKHDFGGVGGDIGIKGKKGGVAFGIPGPAGPIVGAVREVGATDDLTKGKGGRGADRAAAPGMRSDQSYTATLARNACHFPPESWLRWRDYHEKARELIDSATLGDLDQKANEAIARNAFGEHYLQDSFAGGHLINKQFVMAVMQEEAYMPTKAWRGMSGASLRHMSDVSAHQEAYDAPQMAQDATDLRAQGGVRNRRAAVLKERRIDQLRARDPQSALDRARRSPGTAADRARAEVAAAGLDPDVVSFKQYRAFLNDLWFQKMTNALHDKFCKAGLVVGSPHNPNIGRVYGDSSMLMSEAGTEYTAQTSRLSRDAINALYRRKHAELTGQFGPAPAIPSTNEILARFPDRVYDDVTGVQMPLKEWATGQPMRRLISKMMGEARMARPVSSLKLISGGLDHGKLPSQHVPF